MPMGKFINYGEIKEDDDEDEKMLDIPGSVTSVDINAIKENSSDINIDKGGAALDNLLNLGNPTSSVPSNDFITPAEKIVKTDPNEEVVDKSSDYFKTPDLSSFELPSTVINPMDNNLLIPSEPAQKNNNFNLGESNKYTIEEATSKIRELIRDLESHGVKVNTDEMNFEKSYQIIIKLDKTQM